MTEGTASNWQCDVTRCWIRIVMGGNQTGQGKVNARTKNPDGIRQQTHGNNPTTLAKLLHYTS